MDKPHVTICVPAFNAARAIGRTLDSLVSQDYSDYDILVCDNASSDGTAAIVKSYAEKGVRYFLNPVQQQFGESNWNYALSLAEGPLIALYHADDVYEHNMVSKGVAFLQKNPAATAVFTMTQLIDEKDRLIRMGEIRLPKEYRGQHIFCYEDLLIATLKYGTFTVVPTMMTRKDVLALAGNFNWQQFRSASDIDLFLRMSRIGPIGIIDEPLHKYRISPQQFSNFIAKSRTHLAHFFWVMDHYINLPESKKMVSDKVKALYQMERSADEVLCAMNLLIANKLKDARLRLREALKLKHLITSVRRPRRFLRFIIGFCMLAATFVNFGLLCAKGVNRLYQWDLARRRRYN